MEPIDFVGFALLGVLMMLPLGSVYYVLKRLGWDKRNRLFLDAWYVWLAWLVPSLMMLVLAVVLDHQLHHSQDSQRLR